MIVGLRFVLLLCPFFELSHAYVDSVIPVHLKEPYESTNGNRAEMLDRNVRLLAVMNLMQQVSRGYMILHYGEFVGLATLQRALVQAVRDRGAVDTGRELLPGAWWPFGYFSTLHSLLNAKNATSCFSKYRRRSGK